MAIEIGCPKCNAKLRVPDEAAGAQAKCPYCEHVFDVNQAPPVDSSDPPPPPPPRTEPLPPGPAPTSANPYEAPHADEVRMERRDPIELGRVNPTMALQLAWELFTANLAVLQPTHLTFLVISTAVSLMAQNAADNGAQAAAAALNIGGTLLQWFMSIGLL